MNVSRLLIVSVALCLASSLSLYSSPKTKGKKKSKGSSTSVTNGVYHYLAYKPKPYDSLSSKKWPLLIYLHGRSASGTNLNSVRRYGVPFYMDRGMVLDAVVAPQCPSGKKWETGDWFTPFYNDILKKYNIDTTRIYLTGMSMGGFGAWSLGLKYPGRFAAIVPFCGGHFNEAAIAQLKDVPIWVFHGSADTQVPFRRSSELVEVLRNAGGTPKFTVLKGAGHDIHHGFSDERIYQWMFKYRRGDKMLPEDVSPTDTIVWKTISKPTIKPSTKEEEKSE